MCECVEVCVRVCVCVCERERESVCDPKSESRLWVCVQGSLTPHVFDTRTGRAPENPTPQTLTHYVSRGRGREREQESERERAREKGGGRVKSLHSPLVRVRSPRWSSAFEVDGFGLGW